MCACISGCLFVLDKDICISIYGRSSLLVFSVVFYFCRSLAQNCMQKYMQPSCADDVAVLYASCNEQRNAHTATTYLVYPCFGLGGLLDSVVFLHWSSHALRIVEDRVLYCCRAA
jgi:hypothetical protein